MEQSNIHANMEDAKGDLELDADNHQSSMSSGPQPVRKAISLNLTKKTKMRAKSSNTKSKSRRDRRSEREGDGESAEGKGVRRNKASYDKKRETNEEDDREDEELDWSHTVMFVGEKVQDPMIHMCEKCFLPILFYGRLNPCKHVFCFSCAERSNGSCTRCEERVDRIEKASFGQIFVCSYGGSRNGVSGCRRSYLSLRDLIAHIKHRHEKEGSVIPEAELLRQQGAMCMPFFSAQNFMMNISTSNPTAQAAIPGSMVLGPQQPIFVDPNRLPLIQGAQVQLQTIPQAATMALTQAQYQGTATTFLPQTQQQFTGLQQGGTNTGQRPSADMHSNTRISQSQQPPPSAQQQQQMNLHQPQQGDWRNNQDWQSSNQGRSGGQPPYYK